MKIISAIKKYFLLFFRKGVIEEDIKDPNADYKIEILSNFYRTCHHFDIPTDCVTYNKDGSVDVMGAINKEGKRITKPEMYKYLVETWESYK